jgi:predicted acetyltransferase
LAEHGQCDIERSPAGWDVYFKKWEDGWVVVDRDGKGPVRGYLAFTQSQIDGRDFVNVTETAYEDFAGLHRLLHFLASLRDQYSFATMILRTELPLNRILRESQLPHRLVNHAHAAAEPFTRMSLRVLDHKRLIESMKIPETAEGWVIVSIHECEGHESRLAIEMNEGRASVAVSNASPEFECTDRIWSAIVTGDLKATTAIEMGLATAKSVAAAEVLDAFSAGPTPFCLEYF